VKRCFASKAALAACIVSALAGCGSVSRSPIADAHGAAAPPFDWSEFTLPGKRRTAYTADIEHGRRVVHARAVSSASMLRRAVRLPTEAIAGIEFSWLARALIAEADLTAADSADSPVRIVLAFEGDASRLSARNRMLFDLAQALTGEAPPFATLMYVWDNKVPCETVVHSARTDRVRKIVVETGPGRVGQWLHYRRDVRADYRRAFGEDPGPLIGIGLMSDTDNTRSSVEASYGEIHLLSSGIASR